MKRSAHNLRSTIVVTKKQTKKQTVVLDDKYFFRGWFFVDGSLFKTIYLHINIYECVRVYSKNIFSNLSSCV